MSGLACVWHRDGAPGAAELVGHLLAAMPERGPDGANQRDWGEGAIGHLHFRTTPEEATERQPLAAADGTVLLAFDGRLDERLALFAWLWKAAPAKTSSDAELVLAAWQKWGEGALRHLAGPFSLVVWDGRRRELLLARDVLGGRGLAFSLSPKRLVVASSEHAMLAVPGFERRLEESRIAQCLALAPLVDGRTFFAGVEQLLPGEALVVGETEQRRWRFARLELERPLPRPPEAKAELFLQILKESVRCRLRGADHPGLLLSGGLDSAALAALATGLLAAAAPASGARLATFSWVFDEHPSSDERRYQGALAEALPLAPHAIPCDDAWPLSEPATWPVHPATPEQNAYRRFHERAYAAASAAGSRVVLSGMGGDQLYGGTSRWLRDLFAEGRPFAALAEMVRHVRAGRSLEALLVGWLPERRRPRWQPPAWLTPEAVALVPEPRPWPPEAAYAARRPAQAWRLLELLDTHGYAVEAFYAGRHGVELRYPYRDRRMVELMLALPTEDLVARGVARPILRRALAGLLPALVLERKDKASFEPIFRRGLFDREAAQVAALLDRPDALWPRFVRREWLDRARASGAAAPTESLVLWMCATLELWLIRWHKSC